MISAHDASKQIKKYLKEYAIDGMIDKNSLDIIKYELAKKKDVYTPRNMHKTVEMKYDGEIIEIDAQISDLMKCMWMCKIETMNSCQNNTPKNYIWIEFLYFVSLLQFHDILFNGLDNDNEVKIRALDMSYHHDGAWKWDLAFETYVEPYTATKKTYM